MAREIITLEVMATSPEVDIDALATQVVETVTSFVEEDEVETKVEIVPVAFGLKQVKVQFVRDEGKGDLEALCASIADFENVQSCDATDLRRALG